MSTINFTHAENCTICLEPYSPGEIQARIHTASLIPHNFHEACIRTHAIKGVKKHLCPLCNQPLQNVTFWQKNNEDTYTQVERAPLIRRVDEDLNNQFLKYAFRFLCIGLTLVVIKAWQNGEFGV